MKTLADYLEEEWRPALGCTEPASIAYAAAAAAAWGAGRIEQVRLACDPRMYKNCYAVGIPHSGHKVGVEWAVAIGCHLRTPELKLECFRQIDADVLRRAGELLDRGGVHVEVDRARGSLHVACEVQRVDGVGRAVIEMEHTNIVSLEHNGVPQPIDRSHVPGACASSVRQTLTERTFDELLSFAQSLTTSDRKQLRAGMGLNLAIGKHGLSLFPEQFIKAGGADPLSSAGRMVCAGVYARMWGEDLTVMSLAGSGNKGITCAVPMAILGEALSLTDELVEEALALACLVTSASTYHLGTLSAVCGCSNAAGLGLAAGLVRLQGGDTDAISRAISNMVGNVTGMICDGAKIGCAMKTMTAVDAAFRAATLALNGIGIPHSDGIVGADGIGSLRNLGRIATTGMTSMDNEILSIMEDKLLARAGYSKQ